MTVEFFNATRVSSRRPRATTFITGARLALVVALSWTVATGTRTARAEEAAAAAPPAAAAMPAEAPPEATAPPTMVAQASTSGPPAPSGSAGDPTAVTASASAPVVVPPVAPPPPPYSLPWQLRPVTVGNVVRLDSATALYKDPMGNSGSTVATMVTGSYKITPEIAPMVRLGLSKNDAAAMAADGSSFLNPIVGATYARKLGSFRLAGFLATTIPIGMGGGDMPDAGAAGANAAGIKARSAMDNAMFAVNYMTGIAGVGFAYVDHKFTAQVEATLLQLSRVRGDNALSATDSTRTNSTAGIHLGYFLLPQVSLGGELRYQRWLSHPTSRVAATGALVPIPDANMDTVTFAVGPRAHFKIGKTMWIRPGISYAHGLDAPLTNTSFNVFQIDVPVIF